MQDVRYAIRSWRRAPAIPAVALTALTFGIGANIAIFSVVHAVLLRPLPVGEPAALMLLRETNTARGIEVSAVSLPNYLSWREQARSLELAAYSGQSLTWTGAEYPERVEALAPTASFLSVVRAPLLAGRWFSADEERLGPHRVAVLSHTFWRTRFGSETQVVGRQLVLNGAPYTVIGVASADLSVPSEPDLWVPQVVDQSAARRDNRYLAVVGRLRSGFTRAQAQAEMTAMAIDLERQFPDANRDFRVSVVPLQEALLPAEVRAAVLVLAAAAAMVLLIACGNVANVLLSRAAARRKEIAIRTALGAGASRIARQLLTESLLLSMGGAVLGLLLCAATVGVARRVLVDFVPRAQDIALNGPVLAFALAIAVLTGVGFGLAPLWHAIRARSTAMLHAGGRDDRSPARSGVRALLVVGQVSLTTVLLIGAGLLGQSLVKLQRVPVGINADSVVTAKLSLTRARLPNGAAIDRFLSQLTDDLQGATGVRAAGISSAIPLSPGAQTMTRASVDAASAAVTCEWRLVDDGYFRTLQIPLLRGRLFGAQDGAASPRVFVISQQTATALYGREDPIGRRLQLAVGGSGKVVGVVADVRMKQLDAAPERVVYFPPSQFGFFPLFNVVVRTEGPPDAAAAVIRERLKAHDPNLAAYEVRSMQHWVDRSAGLMRIRTQLVAVLAAVALLLGVVGIYGVMSYLVAQRTHEFGVRIALGAPPSALPLGVVVQSLGYTLPGIALGLAMAALATDRMRTLLFEIDPRDPATFAAIGIGVGVVAVAAAYVPARRAAAADPLTVLRAE